MIIFTKKYILGVIILFMSQASWARAELTKFNHYLAQEYHLYLKQAKTEDQPGKIKYFDNKERHIKAGATIPPETPEGKNIPIYLMPMLRQAHNSIQEIVVPPMMQEYPEETAKLQSLYDCWIVEQMDGSSKERIYQYREKFYELLNQLYKKGSSKGLISTIFSVDQPSILIYFRKGSSDVTEYGYKKIAAIAAQLKSSFSYDVTLNAYAEKSEGEINALMLAKQRAKSVKEALLEEGLNPDNITIFSFGDPANQNLVQTTSGNDNQNRSVEIVVDFLK